MRSAGAIPNSSAVATATSAVKPTTRQSSDRSRTTVLRGVESCADDQAAAPLREQQSEAAPDDGQQQALDQQLPGERKREAPSASRMRELVAAAGGARQHQVGDVRAGDQQHQHDDRHDDPERPLVAGAKAGRTGSGRNQRQAVAQILLELGGGQPSGSVASRTCGWIARSAAVACSAVWPGFSRAMISSTQVDRASSQLRGPRTIACVPIGTATSNDRPAVGRGMTAASRRRS